jgi:hypothetical protein
MVAVMIVEDETAETISRCLDQLADNVAHDVELFGSVAHRHPPVVAGPMGYSGP